MQFLQHRAITLKTYQQMSMSSRTRHLKSSASVLTGHGTSKAPGKLLPGERAPEPEQCAGKAHAHAHAQANPHAHKPSAQLQALQVC